LLNTLQDVKRTSTACERLVLPNSRGKKDLGEKKNCSKQGGQSGTEAAGKTGRGENAHRIPKSWGEGRGTQKQTKESSHPLRGVSAGKKKKKRIKRPFPGKTEFSDWAGGGSWVEEGTQPLKGPEGTPV